MSNNGVLLSKNRIVNLATPDTNITHLKNSDVKLFNAIKNLGTAAGQLTNSVFPVPPQNGYRGRIIIPGIPIVANDILSHRYHVVLPTDPTGYWNYNNINLTGAYVTCMIPPATAALSLDIKVCSPITALGTQATIGSNTIAITVANPKIQVGAYIAGIGIPLGTTITVVAGTTLTISNNTTAVLSGNVVTIMLWRSIFKPSMNPQIPISVVTTHDVQLAISVLNQDDLGRVDVLACDTVVSGIEIALVGNYSMTEITVP